MFDGIPQALSATVICSKVKEAIHCKLALGTAKAIKLGMSSIRMLQQTPQPWRYFQACFGLEGFEQVIRWSGAGNRFASLVNVEFD
jgi:hypothetical protein